MKNFIMWKACFRFENGKEWSFSFALACDYDTAYRFARIAFAHEIPQGEFKLTVTKA